MVSFNRKFSILLCLCFSLLIGLCFTSADQDGLLNFEGENHRQGKFFSRNFWDGFERGLRDTADVFSRVSDNLEVAFDQMAGDLGDNLNTFADSIERRVGSTFLRDTSEVSEQPFAVDAISGSLGGGIDDGLEVFYPVEGEDQEGQDSVPKGVRIDLGEYPRPVEGAPVVPQGKDEGLAIRIPFAGDYLNPFGSFGGSNIFKIFQRRKPWWKGENVCIDREETDESESNGEDDVIVDAEIDTTTIGRESKDPAVDKESNTPFVNFFSGLQMSSCTDNGRKYICVTTTNRRGLRKTVKVTYRCCHGFVRDGSGCTGIELLPMPETLEDIGDTSDFLSLVKAGNLVDMITEMNLTMFVPNNEAIIEFTTELEEKNEIQNSVDGFSNNVYRRRRNAHTLSPMIMSHMTEGFLYAGDFVDEQVIPSVNEDSTLRINIYNNHPPSVTVNCARVIKANQHSLNGVVHTIDRVLSPVVNSIADIIAYDPQFSILSKLLKNTGMDEELRKPGQTTFFAPSDAAFRRLKPALLNSLLEGSSCLDAVLKQHMLENTICSAAIQGKMKTLNKLNEYLIVQRDDEDELLVQESKIVARDIVGKNGVVHIIDSPLMPNEGKSISEVLEFHNVTEFMNLLTISGLMEELNAMKDITIFAPSNKAIENIPREEIEELKSDKQRLREALRYHVMDSPVRSDDMNNNQLADTTAGHALRINLYSRAPLLSGIISVGRRNPVKVTAGCSRISILDSSACGAVVHVVEDMLRVPQSDVLKTLDQDTFSIFRQMVKDAEIEEELSAKGPFTILAPSDHALRTLPETELQEILNNVELKKKIVRAHVLEEHICCSGINPNNFLFMDRKRTLDGSQIHIRRNSAGRLMAGPSRITKCGTPTSNGIVHTINRMVTGDRDIIEMMGKPQGASNRRILPIPNFGDLFVF